MRNEKHAPRIFINLEPCVMGDQSFEWQRYFPTDVEYVPLTELTEVEQRLKEAEEALRFYAENGNYDREGAIWDGKVNEGTWTDRSS